MTDSPLPPAPEASPIRGKVLVVNGDLHGLHFFDTRGEKILPGQAAWVWPAHADALAQRNRFFKRVDT